MAWTAVPVIWAVAAGEQEFGTPLKSTLRRRRSRRRRKGWRRKRR